MFSPIQFYQLPMPIINNVWRLKILTASKKELLGKLNTDGCIVFTQPWYIGNNTNQKKGLVSKVDFIKRAI